MLFQGYFNSVKTIHVIPDVFLLRFRYGGPKHEFWSFRNLCQVVGRDRVLHTKYPMKNFLHQSHIQHWHTSMFKTCSKAVLLESVSIRRCIGAKYISCFRWNGTKIPILSAVWKRHKCHKRHTLLKIQRINISIRCSTHTHYELFVWSFQIRAESSLDLNFNRRHRLSHQCQKVDFSIHLVVCDNQTQFTDTDSHIRAHYIVIESNK